MEAQRPNTLDRFLRLFTDVRSGEGLNAALLSLNIFLILTAYYLLKPVREALILGEGSAELKSYLSAGQVFFLAIMVPIYARLAARVPRRRLVNLVTAFYVVCLVVFYILSLFDYQTIETGTIGIDCKYITGTAIEKSIKYD